MRIRNSYDSYPCNYASLLPNDKQVTKLQAFGLI